jgi:hypothetical protein
MRTELVYVALDDHRLERLLEASAALNRTVEELIQEAVERFLAQRRGSH